MKRASKKMTAKLTKTPFDKMAERRRQRTFLLRLNDEEMAKLDELAVVHNVSRSNIMRMMLKHAYDEAVGGPLRERAESEIAAEASKRAVNDLIDNFRKELLAGSRSRVRSRDGLREDEGTG